MKRLLIRYILKYSLLVVGSLLAFLLIVTVVINFLFKDQLIHFAIGQLNKQIDARINIGEVDFSLWKQFPNASVQFNNVYVEPSYHFKSINSSIGKKDTLLIAERIFLEFNLIKLLRGNYELKRLNIENGYLKLKIDKEGHENYNILKPTEKSSPESQFCLQLNDLLFKNTVLEYNNLKSSVKIVLIADWLRLKGDFKAKTYDLKIQSSLFAKQLMVDDKNYILNKPLKLDVNLFVNDSRLIFKKANFSLVNLNFHANGEINVGNKGIINLNFSGNKLDLSQILEALPDHIRKNLNDYSGSGKADINFKLTGPIGDYGIPNATIKFYLKEASLAHKTTGVKLKNINLQGYYSNTLNKTIKESIIKINKFNSVLGSGSISGGLSINNLSKPKIEVNLLYDLNLSELKDFFNLDTLETLSGSVIGNITGSAVLPALTSVKLSEISNLTCVGEVNFKEVSIKLKDNDYHFEKINGSLVLNNDLLFKNISLYEHGNDYLINGSLINAFQYFLKQRRDVTLQAEVTSHNLDLSNYFVPNNKKAKTEEYSRELLFPENINFNVKLYIDNFKLNKFNAKKGIVYLEYKPKIFVFKSLSFETLTGRVSGEGAIIQDLNKNFIVKGQADVYKLDIQKLFYTFNNFTQNIILDRHLRGRLSGKIGVSAEWNNALSFNYDKLLVDADISIDNGELINFEPMYNLSKFVSVDELKNIKFSTLKNKIYIKDKQIIIPQMDVFSSAFHISASGTHLFDNHYNYKVKVLLSEVLWKKAKKIKQENEEFGVVEDDGLGKTGLYLSIAGFNTNYKISYDSKQTIYQAKESLKKQKIELKSILNEEFGWFKKDSTLKTGKTITKNKVRMDWEESNENSKPLEKSKFNKEKGKNSSEEKLKVEWE